MKDLTPEQLKELNLIGCIWPDKQPTDKDRADKYRELIIGM
jgi:hypothetical protein